MKCFILCLIVLLCCISRVQSRPQGFFGGLLPTVSPQGGSPPKRPLGIFSLGQQNAQNPVGGFLSGFTNVREKIKTEAEKRIQAFLNTTMGNKNQVDPVVPPENHGETTDKNKEEKIPEQPEEVSSNNKKKEPDSPPKKQKQPESNQKETDVPPQKEQGISDKKETDDPLEKQPEKNIKRESLEKQPEHLTQTNSSTTEVLPTSVRNLDKMIEDYFSTSNPSKDNTEEENSTEIPVKTADGDEKSESPSSEQPTTEKKSSGSLQSFLSAVFPAGANGGGKEQNGNKKE